MKRLSEEISPEPEEEEDCPPEDLPPPFCPEDCEEDAPSLTTWMEAWLDVILSPESVAVAAGSWNVPVDLGIRIYVNVV